MSSDRPFHRPVHRADLDGYDSHPGPAEQTEAAHELAHMIICDPGRDRDQAAADRFVQLADRHGLERIAELWSAAPAVSLPGALWRLYALRTWIRRRPDEASNWYRTGRSDGKAAVAELVAGTPYMPTPDELAEVVDDILRGAFQGDFAIALERASAFVQVVARGRASTSGPPEGLRSFARMSDDFRAAAQQYRSGKLV